MPASAPFNSFPQTRLGDGWVLTLNFSEDRSADAFRAFVYDDQYKKTTGDATFNLTETTEITKVGTAITFTLTVANITTIGAGEKQLIIQITPVGGLEDSFLVGELFVGQAGAVPKITASSAVTITIDGTSVTVTPSFGAFLYSSINGQTALATFDDEADEVVFANVSGVVLGKLLFSTIFDYQQARTEVLTNKTLVTPTVASLTNMQHSHLNAAGGGTITEAAISDLGTAVALVADNLSVFAATSSAQLAGVISDETGSGLLTFATSPTFITDITVPLVIGGTGTTSDLTLKTTSGVGASGADMHFLVGNNGGTEALTILNDGKVGIGTTAPSAPLHVALSSGTLPSIAAATVMIIQNNAIAGDAVGLSLIASSTLGTAISSINFGDDDAEDRGSINYRHNQDRLFFNAGGVQILHLRSGLVGIGTAAPTSLLHTAATYTASSGVEIHHQYSPTYNQTSTAGYTVIEVDVTETATGSGEKLLLDLQVGSTSLFHVDNLGGLHINYIADANDQDALEIDVTAGGFGDIEAIDIVYKTGAIGAGDDAACIVIQLIETGSTGGEAFGVEMLATDDGSVVPIGMKVGAGVEAIRQESGTFINPTTATDNTTSTDVGNMLDGNAGTTTTIFENDNEYVIFGNVAAYQELEIILTTPASGGGIVPTFAYSVSGAHTFTTFNPTDGTNGFRNSGNISWEPEDLVNHVANSNTGTFDILITRTRNNLTTPPVLGYAKTAVETEFSWDASGDLSVNSIDIASASSYKVNSTSVLNATTLGAGVVSSSLTSFGTSPVLTTPTVASLTNMQHSHLNAAGGGTITEAAISDLGTTVALVADNLSVFAATTSLQLLGVISDETGSGLLTFATTPTFTTNLTVPLVIGGTGTTSDLSFKTTSGVGASGADMHFLVGNNGATEAMSILNDGKVGIGTAVPVDKLHVAGGINVSAAGIASTNSVTLSYESTFGRLQTWSGKALALNPLGNDVGIGTATPTYQLDVFEDADVWHVSFGGDTGELRIGGQPTGGAVIQAITPGGVARDLYIQRDGGDVGIGTAAPGFLLDVNGTLGVSGDITLADAVNVILNATTGTIWGEATSQKQAWWGATPIVQPVGAAQAAPAAYATGAFGLDTDVKMQALFDLVVAIRLALVNEGLMKGAA